MPHDPELNHDSRIDKLEKMIANGTESEYESYAFNNPKEELWTLRRLKKDVQKMKQLGVKF